MPRGCGKGIGSFSGSLDTFPPLPQIPGKALVREPPPALSCSRCPCAWNPRVLRDLRPAPGTSDPSLPSPGSRHSFCFAELIPQFPHSELIPWSGTGCDPGAAERWIPPPGSSKTGNGFSELLLSPPEELRGRAGSSRNAAGAVFPVQILKPGLAALLETRTRKNIHVFPQRERAPGSVFVPRVASPPLLRDPGAGNAVTPGPSRVWGTSGFGARRAMVGIPLEGIHGGDPRSRFPRLAFGVQRGPEAPGTVGTGRCQLFGRQEQTRGANKEPASWKSGRESSPGSGPALLPSRARWAAGITPEPLRRRSRDRHMPGRVTGQ